MARHGRILDWAGESQYYVEPKRLAKLGYLTARVEPGKTRQRTVYTLTDKGLEALAAWARTAVRFTPVKSELLLRLLIADLVGEAVTRESITTIRDDISDLFVRLEESEAFAQTRPSWTKWWPRKFVGGQAPGSWPSPARWTVQAVSRASWGVPTGRPVIRTASS